MNEILEKNRQDLIKNYESKTYLGDGLYVHFDGYHFVLSTQRENGEHWVGLEPPVIDALMNYRQRCYDDFKELEKSERAVK